MLLIGRRRLGKQVSKVVERSGLAFAVGSLLAGSVLVGAINPVSAQQLTPPNSMLQMGMHIPQAKDGVWPDVPIGSIRLWDTGVSWREINTAAGVYDWSTLDRVVDLASRNNAAVLYAFGNTPSWAAEPGCLERQGGAIKGAGANCPAKDKKSFTDFASALADRYKGRIEAYELWNEANIGTFWQGTTLELFSMTSEGARAIRAKDPNAKIVSASVTTRLDTAFTKFLPEYLDLLRTANWPIDAFAVHTYPAGSFPGNTLRQQALNAVEARTESIKRVHSSLAAFAKPSRVEIWDTELNFGLAGPGPTPHTDYPDLVQASLVTLSYFESWSTGIARTYWFAWGPKDQESIVKFGVTSNNDSVGAKAFSRYGDWVRAGFFGIDGSKCAGRSVGREAAQSTYSVVTCLISEKDGMQVRFGVVGENVLGLVWGNRTGGLLWASLGPCVDRPREPTLVPVEIFSSVPYIVTTGGGTCSSLT